MNNISKKISVALITGGLSGEAEISYKSAANVAARLDREKFECYLVDICKEGWLYVSEDGHRQQLDRSDFSMVLHDKKIKFDVALMCLHGTPGEDGKLPGYFDMIGLPYTCCDAATSAITFNKKFTVALAAYYGVHVAQSRMFSKKKGFDITELKALRYPVFIKPNNGGSSLATFKVLAYDESLIHTHLEKAFAVDDEVMIEEFIRGRELTVGVYMSQGEIIVLPISEVVMPATVDGTQYFDFEAKYSGKTTEITPADVTEDIKQKINDAALRLYKGLNCSGVVRIDFIYQEEEGKAYMLEINTVPGQTDTSFIPQQVRASGRSVTGFYTALIEEALRLHSANTKN